MLKFQTFGGLELRSPEGRELTELLAQPKRVALLAYLAVSPSSRFHRRDLLLGVFWPELDQDHARAALRQTLHGLRQTLGAGILSSRGDEEIGLNRELLECDALSFEAQLAAGEREAALNTYRGDFLAGFFLSGAPDFDRWLEEQRTRLRQRAVTAAGDLADRAEQHGDAQAALSWARRAAALAPDEERHQRRLIALLDAQGDRAGALRAYEAFAQRLAQEFEAEPSIETQALIAAVRARRAAPRVPASEPSPATPLEPALAAAVPSPPSAAPRRLAPLALSGVGLVLLAGWLAVGLRTRKSNIVPDPRRVAVAVFQNRTGDSTLDLVGVMAQDWIARGLATTGVLEVADPDTVRSHSDSAGARALAEDSRAGTVIRGAFYRQGEDLRFEPQLLDAGGERLAAPIEPAVGPLADPPKAIEILRQRLMGALAARFDPVLADSGYLAGPPPSYQAYLELLAGEEASRRLDAQGALVHFYRAAAGDSSFTWPLVRAAGMHRYLRQCTETDSISRHFSGNRLLPRLQRLWLDKLVAECRGDLLRMYELSRQLAGLLPGSDQALHALGRDALMVDRPREALAALERVDPERGSVRGQPYFFLWLASAHHLLGEHAAELRRAEQARRLYPASMGMLRLQVFALAAEGRVPEINRLLDELPTLQPGVERKPSMVLRETALELRAHGYSEPAHELLRRTLAWLNARQAEEQATPFNRFEVVQTLLAQGEWDQARPLAARLAAEFPDSVSYQGLLGVLAAQHGDRPEAERVTRWLEALPRPYLRGDFLYWEAAIAAHLGDRARAVALLLEAYGHGLAYGTTPQTTGGTYGGPSLHTDPNFESLHGYAPFVALERPKG